MLSIDHPSRIKKPSLHHRARNFAWALLTPILVNPAYSQVSAVASSVNNKLSGFLTVITAVGLTLFTAAIVMAGYKFAFKEGTKIHDLTGLLIGGVLFGAAGAIASYINS